MWLTWLLALLTLRVSVLFRTPGAPILFYRSISFDVTVAVVLRGQCLHSPKLTVWV